MSSDETDGRPRSRWRRARKLTAKLLFVFTAIVVLIAFADPGQPDYAWFFGPGAALAALGEALRLWATGHLEKNQKLTSAGPYAHVKNPLYLGTFLIMIGFGLMGRGPTPANWIVLGVGIAVFVAYYAPYKKKREGDRMREKFGEAWDRYDRAVPDYIPRLTPYAERARERWSWETMVGNSELWTLLAVAAGVAAILVSPEIQRLGVFQGL